MRLTRWYLFSRVDVFKQADGKVYHVRLSRELILSSLDLFGRKESRLGKIREKRKSQMPVQVRNNLLREVPLGHASASDFWGLRGNPLGWDDVFRDFVDFFYQSQLLPDMEGDRGVPRTHYRPTIVLENILRWLNKKKHGTRY